MTDPTQTGDPQQQSQQWYSDDILGWEDIFAAIPKAAKEKQEISYGELLEKKYQFTPISEEISPVEDTPNDQEEIHPLDPIPEVESMIEYPIAEEISPSVSLQAKQVMTEEIKEDRIPAMPTAKIEQVDTHTTEAPVAAEKITVPVNKIQQDIVVEKLEIAKGAPAVQAVKSREIPAPVQAVPTKTENKKPIVQITPTAYIASSTQKQASVKEEVVQPATEERKSPTQKITQTKESVKESMRESKLQTDVQKKFGELFSITKKIYHHKDALWFTEETFDILWADNDKIFISYRFLLDETDEALLFITKIEQDKETEEETINELRFIFNEETLSLEVMINDTLLFDEVEDFSQDQKKKMQVVDKINKFTFLASEELRKIEKEIKEKEEAEQERKKLQEIFRNF